MELKLLKCKNKILQLKHIDNQQIILIEKYNFILYR